MSHNQYPANPGPTPAEELNIFVNGLLPAQQSDLPQSATRYSGGYIDRTITLTRDFGTGDVAIDYDDTGATSGFLLTENHGFKNLGVLTTDGKIIDTSGQETPKNYDHEREYASVLLDALKFSSDRPLRAIGRLMLLRRSNK